MTVRCFFVCCGLLLFAQGVNGGVYQRTRDGETLVWNNYPSPQDQATWSGKRDARGYAIGHGTLTWYNAGHVFLTGSHLPSREQASVIGRYSGNMVRGKFNGPVLNVDADGKTLHLTFVNGVRVGGRPSATTAVSAPAEGPGNNAEQLAQRRVSGGVVEAPVEGAPMPVVIPTATPSIQVVMLARPSPAAVAPTPSPNPGEMDSAVKDRIIADFKEETQAVLSRVDEATGNFRGIDRLDSVGQLPPTVSESVGALVDRARSFRSKVGYETALRECRTETETVDALSTVDQITRSVASNNASEAGKKLTDFLKNNPEPSTDGQKPLWSYLTSMRQLCTRLEEDANVHLQRGQSLAAASRTSEAIREYQEAYRIFPSPATAEKIRQLQDNSLGL